MLAVIFSVLPDFVAVLLTGLVIKFVDDYLDQEQDMVVGRYSVVQRLGIGTVAYAVLLFAIAVALHHQYSIALIFASYIVGMTSDLRQQLPTGLLGWQEILVVSIISVLIVGLQNTAVAVCCMLFVQVIDDWFDRQLDDKSGQRNLFRVLGHVEAVLCGLIMFFIAMQLNSYLTLMVTAATVVIWVFLQRMEMLVHRPW